MAQTMKCKKCNGSGKVILVLTNESWPCVPCKGTGRVSYEPSIATMQKWMMDGVAKATDGCRVEPDGSCPHGKPSWLMKLGYI